MVKIAVDLDDVLTDSALRFIEYSNATWGYNHSIEDYTEDWLALWQVDEKRGSQMSKQWHDSDAYDAGAPREESIRVLKELSQAHELVVVTSRRDWVRKRTEQWIDDHYPNMFAEVVFAGMWDDDTIDRVNATKASTVLDVGADYLIDDQPKHCHAVVEAGPRAIVFGDYHWNQAVSDEIVRCRDWDDVRDYFRRYE